jgi:site-specific recombinase XerD
MSVTLRKKANRNKTLSTYYLDIYQNNTRTYEFLKHLKHIEKPKNAFEREQNKECEKLAKLIKSKREHELESNDYNITPKFKQKIDFIAFFQDFINTYTKKDKRIVEATFIKFKEFLNDSEIQQLNTNQLDESLVHDFKTYLEQNLNGESPANYFKKFKMLIKTGVRKKIFVSNPAQDITIKKKDSIKKEILTNEDIQILASTPLTNNEVKRAFLFSLFTGLRYSDIIALKWQNIDFKNKILKTIQEKTKEQVIIELHQTALQILDTPAKNTDFVFSLPSHTACNKNLKYWCKKAGINKHITWHCARHSFATNLIFYGADVNTASKLLGHNSLRYTERYTHIVNSLKEKAVSNLPNINL